MGEERAIGFGRLSAEKRATLGRRGGKMAKKRHRWTKHEASKAGKKGMQERYRERRTKLARMIDRLVAKGWSKNKASKHARKLLKEREER